MLPGKKGYSQDILVANVSFETSSHSGWVVTLGQKRVKEKLAL